MIRPLQPDRSGRSMAITLLALAVAAAVAVAVIPAARERVLGVLSGSQKSILPDYVMKVAEKGPFRIVITENGTVDSLRNSTLSNSVEGSTTIISLVPEGSKVNAPVVAEFDGVVQFVDGASESAKTVRVVAEDGQEKVYELIFGEHTELLVKDRQKVRKGDFLAGDVCCELDSSTLVEKEKEQQIKVTTARANLEKALKDIEIQLTTNESNVAKAQLAEDLAALSLVSYTSAGGEYEQELETVKGDIKKTEEELSINREEYERVRDQARLGYANVNQLESARLKVTQSQILLSVNRGKLEVLEKYTRPKKEKELAQTAEDSKRETQRARLEGEALMTQMKAAADAAQLTLSVEDEKLDLFQRQIKACRLVATQAGEVVYASQKSSRGSEPVVIEEGAAVRERQAVINLPDLENMKIDARIHESRISRVMIGQPVEIEIDAIPGDPYRGKLQSVSSVPIPGSWPNTDLKEYEAIVQILDSPERVRKLKPGMTAQIRVVVEDRKEPVLQIPVQSVVSFSGYYYAYVYSGKEQNGAQRRELKVGDANDEYIEILEGTRAHTANIDNYLGRIITSLDDDFNTQFNNPTFKHIREAGRYWDVQMGQIETTTVLTNNRTFAKVSPGAQMEFDLPKRDILLNESLAAAAAAYQDYGALLHDPTFLSLTKAYRGQPSSATYGSHLPTPMVRDVLPGLPSGTRVFHGGAQDCDA